VYVFLGELPLAQLRGDVVVGMAIVLGGSVAAFVDGPSLVLVVGGTLLVTLMKFSFRQFANATKVAIKAFIYRVPDAEELITKSIELANAARASGLLALEEADVPDEFFKKALNLVVDGHDPEVVRSILSKDLDLTLKRHRDGQAIFKAIGDAAPAMGMIGTLIGLVQMLGSMSDPKQIAPAMAIALFDPLPLVPATVMTLYAGGLSFSRSSIPSMRSRLRSIFFGCSVSNHESQRSSVKSRRDDEQRAA